MSQASYLLEPPEGSPPPTHSVSSRRVLILSVKERKLFH